MAVSFVAAGAWGAVSSTTVLVVGIPAGAVEGDLLVVLYVSKPETVQPTMSAGWTHIGSAVSAVAGAVVGADAGNVRAGAFYKYMAAGEPSGQISGTALTSPLQAHMQAWRKDAADTWETPTGVGGGQATGSTSFSVTAPDAEFAAGDFLTGVIGLSGNTTVTSQGVTMTGVTFGARVQAPATNSNTAVGNDGAASGIYLPVTAGAASGGLTATAVLGTIRYGAGYFPRIRAVAPSAIPSGTAAGTVAFSGAAAGSTTRRATATGHVAYTGAATGSAPAAPAASGAASGAFAYLGAAAGSTSRAGAAAGTVTWTGAAGGSAPAVAGASGVASGTYTYTGTATGSTTRDGAATGSFTYIGAGVGSAPAVTIPAGVSTGSVIWRGLATGVVSKAGSAFGTVVYAASAVGSTPRSGEASGHRLHAGTATGEAPLPLAVVTVESSTSALASGTAVADSGGSVVRTSSRPVVRSVRSEGSSR